MGRQPISISTQGTMPPSPPHSTTSPKAVRFNLQSNTSKTIDSRTMTTTERASAKHFEDHADSCHSCQGVYERFRAGKRMCRTGAQLAHDAAMCLYRHDKQIFSALDGARLSLSADFVHIISALKLQSKHGPNAFWGHDDKAASKQKQRPSHHRRHDSHQHESTVKPSQDTHAAANAYCTAQSLNVASMSPSTSRTSSIDSRRPRSLPTDQPQHYPRTEPVAATLDARLPPEGTYQTVNYVPKASRRTHRR